jgi:PKD repeat protein
MAASSIRRRHVVRSALVFVVAALALALPSAGNAAPPANDAFASATPVAALPFSDSVDLSEATLEGGEPGGGCWPLAGSSWYQLQPSQNTIARVSTSAGFDRSVNVFRQNGSGFGGLSFIGCNYNTADLTLSLVGGGRYLVQVGRTPWTSGGMLNLSIATVPPPPNDAFADARSIGSLPYSDSVDMLASTLEAGEPTPSGLGAFQGTAWWSFTAQQSGPLLVGTVGCCGNTNMGVYTGNAVGSLAEVPLTRSYGRAIFQATAGQTYRIQLGHNGLYYGSQQGISLDRAPDPSVSIYSYPYDPSSFDTISFSGNVYDPAGFQVDSWSWTFGDGGSASGQSAQHRYLADGKYSITLGITMIDGRTASWTGDLVVKTHDVSIVKLTVPQTAQAGKTKTITVDVSSSRYDENVSVQLLRSIPGGFEPVGSSIQLVAARKQATSFAFSYTFRPEDAAVGKVTFKAVAVMPGARDALPADNEVVALPTKVS